MAKRRINRRYGQAAADRAIRMESTYVPASHERETEFANVNVSMLSWKVKPESWILAYTCVAMPHVADMNKKVFPKMYRGTQTRDQMGVPRWNARDGYNFSISGMCESVRRASSVETRLTLSSDVAGTIVLGVRARDLIQNQDFG